MDSLVFSIILVITGARIGIMASNAISWAADEETSSQVWCVFGFSAVAGILILLSWWSSIKLIGIINTACFLGAFCIFFIGDLRLNRWMKEERRREYEYNKTHGDVYIDNPNNRVIEKALASRGYKRLIINWHKEILRTDAEEELNFLRSISVPDSNIHIHSSTVYSGESQWKYFPREEGN